MKYFAIIIIILVALSGIYYIKNTMIISSAISGTVVHDGKPVSDAKITRTSLLSMNRKTYRDETITSTDGSFSLPETSARSAWSLFPHEPNIKTTVTIEIEGKKYDAMSLFKRNYDAGGEITGPDGKISPVKTIKLSCDLSSEKHSSGKNVLGDASFGICDISKES